MGLYRPPYTTGGLTACSDLDIPLLVEGTFCA